MSQLKSHWISWFFSLIKTKRKKEKESKGLGLLLPPCVIENEKIDDMWFIIS